MGGGSSNGSSPFFELFGPEWEGKCFSMLSVRYWNRKRFSELFDLDWEGKMLLYAFGSILKSETYVKLGNDSPSVRALGISKRFLDFISGMEVSSRNSHLMHLLKES
ncbi:hypothetical protein C1645_834397, partial [Glomus cerebriforme]